jgi:signal transduction histidine kinase
MRDPLHWLSVKYKLAFGFIGLCLTAFGVGGYFISQIAQQALTGEILKRLEFQSQAYATDLHASLEMLTRRSEDFASDGYIRDHLAAIVAANDPATAEVFRLELHRHLRVNKLPLELAFMDLAVVSQKGQVVVAVHDATSETVQHLAAWSLLQSESRSSEAFAGSDNRSPGLVISTPVYGLQSGEPIGRLLATIRAGVWVSRAMQTARLGRDRSVEDLGLRLYDPVGSCLVVPPRFLNYEKDADVSAPILEGRGLEVLLAHDVNFPTATEAQDEGIFSKRFPIGDSAWTAEVRIHASRALAPVSGLQSEFLLVGLVLAGFSVFLLYFPLNFFARPIIALRNAALAIRSGDFSTRVEVTSEDELGDLARSFNLMASAVENRTSELESTASDLKERQSEVLAQRDRLDRVISTMHDGLVVLGAEGEVLLSNYAAEPILNFIKQETETDSGSRRRCAISESSDLHGCKKCLIDTNDAGPRSCALDLGDRIFDIHATPLPLGDSGRQGRILVSRDITLRVARDEREIHQERLVVLGEVAAVMAHELNNPLASIQMFNQLLEAKLPDGSELQENVDVIRRNTETCKRVIRELLNYATATAPETSEVDLHEVLEDAGRFLRPLMERRGVHLKWNLQAENPEVRGDEVQLRQIFVNLIMNAIQVVDRGGVVELSSVNRDNRLILGVRDNGPGIPAESQAQIFRAFYTTKSRGEGTGLGLPTARRIAELHGGGIELVESSAAGTLFQVRLRPIVEVASS